MMKRKTVFNVLMAAVALSLVFSFAACNSSATEDEDQDVVDPDKKDPDKPVVKTALELIMENKEAKKEAVEAAGALLIATAEDIADAAADAVTFPVLFEAKWTGDFSPDFATDSVKLVNGDGDLLYTAGGAMSLPDNTCQQASNAGFFGSKTTVIFELPGGSWGGVFFEVQTDPLPDLSTATKMFIAIKGDIGADTKYFGAKIMTKAGDEEVNFLLPAYAPVAAARDGWNVYTVPLADFGVADVTEFKGCGIWNPNLITGTVAEREADVTNYPPMDILVSVAFGN